MNGRSTRRSAGLLGSALLFAASLSATAANANPHMLVDVNTLKVIEHEEAFQRWYPASLTKLMTA